MAHSSEQNSEDHRSRLQRRDMLLAGTAMAVISAITAGAQDTDRAGSRHRAPRHALVLQIRKPFEHNDF